jgi:hypothetical protein
LLQLQGFSALDVADEPAFLPCLHLIGACRGGERGAEPEKREWVRGREAGRQRRG